MIDLIDRIVRITTWFKRNQKINVKNNVIKINLGSGLSITEGWINIDSSLNAFLSNFPKHILVLLFKLNNFVLKKIYNSKLGVSQKEFLRILKENRFIHHNLEYGLPFNDESVDYIYSSHFFEHVFKEDAQKLIKESFRVLKKGGIIRIGVPDLERVVSMYQNGEKEKALSILYSESKRSHYSYHRYMYDFDLLYSLMVKGGFETIEKCEYQNGKIPDVKKLDGLWDDTLFIEAFK